MTGCLTYIKTLSFHNIMYFVPRADPILLCLRLTLQVAVLRFVTNYNLEMLLSVSVDCKECI